MLRVREIAFTRKELPNDYPIPSGQPGIHTHNILLIELVIFLYLEKSQ